MSTVTDHMANERTYLAWVRTGKRKTATARAYTKSGTGKFRINDYPVELHPVALLREKLMEPIALIGERSGAIDVDISVSGGGRS